MPRRKPVQKKPAVKKGIGLNMSKLYIMVGPNLRGKKPGSVAFVESDRGPVGFRVRENGEILVDWALKPKK